MVRWFLDPTFQGYTWLIAALLLFLSEIGTPGLFYFLSFAAGALGAAMVAFFGLNIYVQCSVAVITSIIAFFIMRAYVKPHMKPKHKTNIDALMHQEALVIEPIGPHKNGRIKIKGEEWPAITNTNHAFANGTLVTIVGLEGNKLIVK